MDEDDDEFYTTGEPQEIKNEPKHDSAEAMDEDDESEEEESDSDIEIVTEQKETDKVEPPTKSTRTPLTITRPDSTAPTTTGRDSPAIKQPASNTPPPSKPGSSYPALKTSTLDIDAKPIHESSGKAITEVDIDTDLAEDDKPWRVPGSDQTDYFNYGFDEFTWAAYTLKQSTLRTEAKEQKKAMGDFQNMFTGGTGTGPGAANGGGMMPGFPGDMPQDMQAAMQSMMASGMDPSQMDMNSFMQMMGGGGMPGFGGPGGQGMGAGFDGGYGGQQQQQQQQQQGPPSQPQGHAGGGRGGRRGRGRW